MVIRKLALGLVHTFLVLLLVLNLVTCGDDSKFAIIDVNGEDQFWKGDLFATTIVKCENAAQEMLETPKATLNQFQLNFVRAAKVMVGSSS